MIGTIEPGTESAPVAAPSSAPTGVREPNFFIVGAARAGTTSLWQYLRHHPDVYMPQTAQTKEPSYFYELAPPWAPELANLDAYLRLFAPATTERAIGEASVTYLWSQGAAARIRNRYPDARIIIMLRNPAERAYSQYRLLCELGFERSATFERALSVEDVRFERFEQHSPLPLDPYWYSGYFYSRFSFYSSQIERFLNLFPREQVHFVLFEDLHKRPIETTQAVLKFLDVDPSFEPNIKVYNKSYFPLSVRAQSFLGQRWNLHPVGPRRRGPRIRDFTALPIAFGLNLWLGQFRTVKLDGNTRRNLLMRYREDLARTSEIVGRNLTHWLKDRV